MNLNTLSDPSAERAILSGIFNYGGNVYFDIADMIGEQTFTIESNQCIFKCLKHILDKDDSHKIDIPSLYSAAQEIGLGHFFDRTDEARHLQAIISLGVDSKNIRKFAAKIRKLEIARLLRRQLGIAEDKLLEITGEENVAHILSIAEDAVLDLSPLLNDKTESPKLLGENVEEYLNYLGENPVSQIGISTGFPAYDKAIGGGLRKGTVNVIGSRSKALRYGSNVYTQHGPINIENIQTGDLIAHPYSGWTKVLNTHDHYNIEIYRVYLKDGDYIDCCQDHLWEVYKRYPYKKLKDKKSYQKTTKELIDDLVIGKQNKTEYKWDIKLCSPIPYNEQQVPIDAYIMGLLLGDGCFGNAITYYRINGLQPIIRNLDLFHKKAKEKFIPKQYIYNTIENRLKILRGLMDTDATCIREFRDITNNARAKFSTISLQLAKDVKEIIQSLGGLCSINKHYQIYNDESYLSYVCEVRLPNNINPFKLERKAKKYVVNRIQELKRTIVKIEKICIDNARCLTVDNPDGLFLTSNYVVTHNTGKTIITDNVGVHLAQNLNIPVLNMDTEMTREDHIHRTLACMTETAINDIETGKFAVTPDIRKKVYEAGKQLSKIPYHHRSIAGMPFEDQLAIMRRWVIQDVGLHDDGTAKPCVIIYDYLKLMDTQGLANLQEYQLLGFMMTTLHNFAVRYKLPIVGLIQLNRDGINKESTDVASGSDRILWLCSNFSIFKVKSLEEITMDGPENGNRKMVVLASRHGAGMDDGDYINYHFKGWCAKITEGKTKYELAKKQDNDNGGFEVDDDPDDKPIQL